MSATSPSILILALVAVDAPKLPVDKEGNPDYQAALNDRLGKGIAPEKNANVLLWKALGPTPESGDGMPAEYFRRLGIVPPPKDGDYFVDLNEFIRKNTKLDEAAIATFYAEQSRPTQRPWARIAYPQMAAWLAANEMPLAIVAEATKRPQYFNPLIPHRNGKERGSIIGAMLPNVQKCRSIANALRARAMLRVDEKQFDAAWNDLLTCHRLAQLIARGGMLIEALVGIAIDQVASTADLAYLAAADLSSAQIRDRLKALQNLPPLPPMADKIDIAERYVFLDTLEDIRRGEFDPMQESTVGGARKLSPEERKSWAAMDWSPVVRRGNDLYDRAVAALRQKNRLQRLKELDEILETLKSRKKDTEGRSGLPTLWGGNRPTGAMVVERLGHTLIELLLPSFRHVMDAYDRAEQLQRNLQLAFALAAYQRDVGSYPSKLDALAPKYLPSIPGDLFNEKDVIYRPAGKGYLLYSVGVNGKDEEGRSRDDDPPGDDLAVRVPLPEPKPQK